MPLLLLHGLSGNEHDHWQTWVAHEARSAGSEVRYPDLPSPDEPSVDAWVDAVLPLIQLLQPSSAADERPDRDGPDVGGLVVLAHSLGCHLWAHVVARARRQDQARWDPLAARVLLVAPPGELEVREHIPSFEPAALTVGLLAACTSTTVLLGQDDPWIADPGHLLASGLAVRQVADGGHLNVESGYGPWPAMARWVRGGTPPGRRVTLACFR